MKFFQLSSGQRFEFRGEIFVKVGPLVASHEASGRTQLILRSAAVRPLDEEKATPTSECPLCMDRVRKAFETYHDGCAARLADLAPYLDANLMEVTRSGIEEARKRFLDSLVG